MPTYTVRADGAGGAYTTFQTAFAAIPSTLVADTDYIIECTEAGTYSTGGTANAILDCNASKTWGSNSRIIIRASDLVHHVEGAGGVLIDGGSKGAIWFNGPVTSGTANYVVQGLRLTTAISSANGGVCVLQNTGAYTIRFTECWITKTGTTGSNSDMIRYGQGGSNKTLIHDNCTFVDQTSSGTLRCAIGAVYAATALTNWSITVYNCLFVGTQTDIQIATSGVITNCSLTCRNNVFINTTTPVTVPAGFTTSRNYEAHTGTGTSGANSDNNIVAATYYNTGTWARISASTPNPIDDDGENLGSTYERDINGNARSGTWSKGSLEFTNNAPPNITITGVLLNISGTYTNQSEPYSSITSGQWRFTATALDFEEGDITSDILWEAELSIGGGYSTIGTGGSVDWTSPSYAGTHNIRATVVDSGSLSANEIFSVQTKTVISSAGADQTKSGLDPQISLNGSASAVSSGTISYSWNQTLGTPVTLSSRSVASPVFAAPYVYSAATIRIASTSFKIGQVISQYRTTSPTTNVNLTRRYVCIVAGTVNSSEVNGWYDTTSTGQTQVDGTVTWQDIGTSYSGSMPLTFELEVDNGTISDLDTVVVNVNYCRQQALYIMRRATQKAYDIRTKWSTTDGYNLSLWPFSRNTDDWVPPVTSYASDHVSSGYPSGASSAIGFWTVEDGARSYTPSATFSGANGASAILGAIAECYRATGLTFFRDKALDFASSICYVFGKLQFAQDCAVFKTGSFSETGSGLTGIVLPDDTEVGVLLGSSRRTPSGFLTVGTTNESYWDQWNADEGAVGCALSSLIQMHRALRVNGDSIPSWLVDGHSDLPYPNGIKGVIQTYIDLADTDFGDESLGVRKPYSTGGFPEIYPISKAFTANFNGNLGNLWGAYMPDKMVQDNAMSSMMAALGLAVAEFTATGDSFLTSLRSFFDLQVNWILDRMTDYAADGVWGICGQYGIGPTIYKPVAYYDLDEPSFGRPQDHRGVLVGETAIVTLLCWMYRTQVDGSPLLRSEDRLRIADFGGASPTGALPFYLDKVRGTDTGRANDLSIIPFPVQADGQWYRTYIYPDDEHMAEATIALGTAPEILFCISSGSGASTIRKIGYDTIEGTTTPDTSNPNFNIGFVSEATHLNGAGLPASPDTAEGGQTFFFSGGNCDATERILLCNAGTFAAPSGTGYLIESRLGTHRNYVDDGAVFFVSNTWNSSLSQAMDAYEDDYSGWRSGSEYNSTTFGVRLQKIALNYNSIPNVPAIYDADGDGTNMPNIENVSVSRFISGSYSLQSEPYSGTVNSSWRFTSSATDGSTGDDISSSIVWEYNNGVSWVELGTGSSLDWNAPAFVSISMLRARITVGDLENTYSFSISSVSVASEETIANGSTISIYPAKTSYEIGTVLKQEVNNLTSQNISKISLDLTVNSSGRKTLIEGVGDFVSFQAANWQAGRDQWVFQPVNHIQEGFLTSGTPIENTLQETSYTTPDEAASNAPFLQYSLYFPESGFYDIWGYGYVNEPGMYWSIDGNLKNIRKFTVGLLTAGWERIPKWTKIGNIFINAGGLHTFEVYLGDRSCTAMLDQWYFTKNLSLENELESEDYISPFELSDGPYMTAVSIKSGNKSITGWLSSLNILSSGRYNYIVQESSSALGSIFSSPFSIEFWQIGGGKDNFAAWNYGFSEDSVGNSYISTNYGQGFSQL